VAERITNNGGDGLCSGVAVEILYILEEL